jgi:hypothetical protein
VHSPFGTAFLQLCEELDIVAAEEQAA